MNHRTSQCLKSLFVRHSRHEEYVAAAVELPDGQHIDLGARAHHHVLLELARIRLRDRQTGVPPAEEGWVHREELTTRLGTDICHVNVLIHRVRKQLRRQGVANGDEIVERRRGLGEIRLGVPTVTVDAL